MIQAKITEQKLIKDFSLIIKCSTKIICNQSNYLSKIPYIKKLRKVIIMKKFFIIILNSIVLIKPFDDYDRCFRYRNSYRV